MADVLYLSSEEAADLAGMPDYVETVREAYRQFGGAGQLGSEEKLFRESPEGTFMYYGAILPASGVMGTFVYWGGFEAGESWFLTALSDAETGEPLALVDSVGINPYKTGATGGVGTDALARPDASELALIGTGPQAAYQLLAVDEVRDLRSVRAFSPNRASREAFARRMDERFGADVTAVGSPSVALRGADIVVTATSAHDPVIEAGDVAPGTHITAMGQSHPDRRELDSETVGLGLYVPDLRGRALETSGELRGALASGDLDEADVHPGIGELLLGEAPGRTDPEQVTIFDMGGTGVETVAAAHMVAQRARQRDRGTVLPMTRKSQGFEPV